MQIHELTQRQRVDEVDLVGPTGIFAVGKQVLKNPKALYNSPALAAAQQAAAQQSAAASAQKLANPGAFRRAMGNQAYTVGGSIKPTTTVTQQLQVVKSNPAVQQQVKTLAAQWMNLSGAIRTQPLPEAVISAFDPNTLSAEYKSIYDKTKAISDLDKKATRIKNSFQAWSDPLLKTGNISMDVIRQNAETEKLLDAAMNNVALVAALGSDPKMEKTAVEQYMSLAIAAIQTAVQNVAPAKQPASPRSSGGGPTDAEILTQLQNAGVPVTKVDLEKLGQFLISSSGSNTVGDTGNPALNAVLKLAGMRVT